MTADQTRRSATQPIFIVGVVRSGTTLIRLILDSHESIAIPQETGFMRAVQANRFIPFWKLGADWHERLGLSDEEFDRHMRAFYGGLFDEFARGQGKARWGEKTPWHLWHIAGILRLWPEAVFIGMVRHPAGNVGSLMSRWHYDLERSIRNWTRDNTELLYQAAALGDRFAICRYEDLVHDPAETMKELLEWLGEPWSASVLRHHEVQRSRGTPSVVEGQTRSDEAVDPSRATRWSDLLSDADRDALQRETKKLADVFGYSFSDMAELQAIVPPGSGRARIVLGSDLGSLQIDPELLDGSARMQAPPKEWPFDPAKLGMGRRWRRRGES